jgi:phenylacetate-CoA ligase
MNTSNLLTRNIILPLSDLITGQSIFKCLTFLEKSQFWTRGQLDEYQNSKLRDLIHHAYINVPFYREIFLDLRIKPEDIQTKADLDKLPIITKDDFRKYKTKWIAKNIHKNELFYSSSSGSTGEPFQFYTTKTAESMLKASAIRSWYWMGYRLGDKYVKISMNPRNSLIKKIQDSMNRTLYLSSNQLIPSEFNRISCEIEEYNPKFIRCYPVPLQFLAKQIRNKSQRYNGTALKSINTTGSTLHDEVRKEIEDIFEVKIFDAYSCEGGAVFAQCPTHENYHPAEEYAISEFIEDSVTKNDSERPLRHITTDLHNFASPFIRYDSQDYIVLGVEETCNCHRNYLNIKRIKGRDSDLLLTPSGKLLIVENFVAYFEWISEVDQIQVIQEKVDEILIKMIVNKAFTPDVKQKISSYWTNYIGSDVNVIVEVVDEIKLTPAGKRRIVIRNPNIKING